MIRKTAPKVFMTPEAGPAIEGYNDECFQSEAEENEEALVERDIEEESA